MKENKWYKFEKTYKNNLLTLNLFFIFLYSFLPFIFYIYSIFIAFSHKFFENETYPCYVLFLENLRENAREIKYKGKVGEKKSEKKKI